MTQSTFAALMGVSPKTVEAWEAGTNVPLDTARRMLELLQTDNSIPVKYKIVG
ncbi:MAG: helix-turn-helix domain-containing protein [Oscillospiraceae bacterium]